MKNKKILARIFALCSVLVLLFALSVPCFADTPDSVSTDALTAFYSNLNNPLPSDLVDLFGDDIFSYSAISYGGLPAGIAVSVTGIPLYGYVSHDVVADVYLLHNGELVYRLGESVLSCYYDKDSEDYGLTIESNNGDLLLFAFISSDSQMTMQSMRYLDSIVSGDALQEYTLFIGFSGTVGYMNDYALLLNGTANNVSYPAEFLKGYNARSDGGESISPEPTRSGMFGQLYYILRDAIFGVDVVLDGTQDFILTQISTWMTYVVILLPIILVVAIVLKAFRW